MINIKFKNEKSLFIGDKVVKVNRFTKMFEKYIRKGRCAKADKTDDGYDFKLLDADYTYQDYHVEVGGYANSEYARESERLYKLANTKAMKNKFAKTEKDIYTKPSKIFKRNLSKSFGDGSGLFTLTFGISAILSLLLAIPVGVILDSYYPANMLVAGSPLIAQLSTFLVGIPLVNTIKELIKNKKSNKKDDEVPESDEEEKKSIKKAKKEELGQERTLNVVEEKNITKNNSKEQLARTSNEKMVISFLKNKYKELNERRIELINNGGSKDEIAQIVNEMNAVVYKTNSIMSGPTRTETCYEEKPVSLKLR